MKKMIMIIVSLMLVGCTGNSKEDPKQESSTHTLEELQEKVKEVNFDQTNGYRVDTYMNGHASIDMHPEVNYPLQYIYTSLVTPKDAVYQETGGVVYMFSGNTPILTYTGKYDQEKDIIQFYGNTGIEVDVIETVPNYVSKVAYELSFLPEETHLDDYLLSGVSEVTSIEMSENQIEYKYMDEVGNHDIIYYLNGNVVEKIQETIEYYDFEDRLWTSIYTYTSDLPDLDQLTTKAENKDISDIAYKDKIFENKEITEVVELIKSKDSYENGLYSVYVKEGDSLIESIYYDGSDQYNSIKYYYEFGMDKDQVVSLQAFDMDNYGDDNTFEYTNGNSIMNSTSLPMLVQRKIDAIAPIYSIGTIDDLETTDSSIQINYKNGKIKGEIIYTLENNKIIKVIHTQAGDINKVMVIEVITESDLGYLDGQFTRLSSMSKEEINQLNYFNS